MQKKYYFIFISFLLILNVFLWKEVFALSDENLKVYFLDVGQGDAAFIKTPENHQIVIDGGPNSAVLEKISKIMPFWDKTIDMIILSHPERDHMQGLIEILKRYKINYIIESGIVKNTEEFLEWQQLLEKQEKMGAKIINVKSGDLAKIGEINIDILYPLENVAEKEIKDSSNEVCVVTKLIYKENSFLFTGDIGFDEEDEIRDLESDVLKVAHHGSKYSTSDLFLQAVKPIYAVIEVGKNSYGHPTSEVLQRLEKFDIKIFRTDTDGNVEFVSDGNNILIK